MTDKQIINLKPTEDLNEKIIKEKGNTKCIFYADDICRNGDETRDCVNCARVEYHSLYSLNWDNQERLQKIIEQKEQECERLKENLPNAITRLMEEIDQLKAENDDLKRQYKELGQCTKGLKDYFKKEKESLSNKFLKLKQTLTKIKEIAQYDVYTSNTDLCLKLNWIKKKISEVENG